MNVADLHIGRAIRIKTDDEVYDSYISAITLSDENFVYFKSGSLRTTLIDKLKSSENGKGNKLDVSGGVLKGSLNILGNLTISGDITTNIEESQLTVNSNYFSTVEVNKVRKFGRVVIADFRGLVSTNIPNNTDGILILPYSTSIDALETGFAHIGEHYGANANPLWFYIHNILSGTNIALSAVTAGKWLHLHYVYMTND